MYKWTYLQNRNQHRDLENRTNIYRMCHNVHIVLKGSVCICLLHQSLGWCLVPSQAQHMQMLPASPQCCPDSHTLLSLHLSHFSSCSLTTQLPPCTPCFCRDFSKGFFINSFLFFCLFLFLLFATPVACRSSWASDQAQTTDVTTTAAVTMPDP